ncbi:hypothetical protein BOTCAL_0108g00280 [Botryotinia calthae]|uniref:Uncharacterized protein n=1 Tax=Botryotinia calthae TaxID=38488 RepID=A0A4Y8D7Y6_9HELO|nr:hypothetical protein BOTCAL_0108g00280 [Botryotinia calthae]
MVHIEDFKNVARWCAYKDDPFVIHTLADDEAIAFRKDKTMKKIPVTDIKNGKWRELGTFYDYKPKLFQNIAQKRMKADVGTADKGERTAMDVTQTFVNFLCHERKIRFQGNSSSINILHAYAMRSSWKEDLGKLKESQTKLKKKLKDANKAGKGITAASKAVDDIELSIATYNGHIDEQNAKIMEHKVKYEKDKEEQRKRAEETKREKQENERKRMEEAEARKAADEKERKGWNRLIPPDHPYNIKTDQLADASFCGGDKMTNNFISFTCYDCQRRYACLLVVLINSSKQPLQLISSAHASSYQIED